MIKLINTLVTAYGTAHVFAVINTVSKTKENYDSLLLEALHTYFPLYFAENE
jgi:hypothetical protein